MFYLLFFPSELSIILLVFPSSSLAGFYLHIFYSYFFPCNLVILRCHISVCSGSCICLPGYLGSRCSQACLEGRFGVNCSKICDCNPSNTKTCDHKDGTCHCMPGYTHRRCDQVNNVLVIIIMIIINIVVIITINITY